MHLYFEGWKSKMKTKKQEELVNAFISEMDEDSKLLYREIIMYLSELGYNPKKEGSRISFKHDMHTKQIAKMGMTKGKSPSPIFMLRFSACKEYSKRFQDIVSDAVNKDNIREAQCIQNSCDFCAGEADTHVYTYISFDGQTQFHCGASALKIPNITSEDIAEIKKLLMEEHIYLMKHQAGITIEN